MMLAEDARVALYYAPATADPLWQAGSAWLGRDAETGETLAGPDLCGLDRLTANPRSYGFHATLKAPFRLRPGVIWDDVLQRTTDLCQRLVPFALPALQPTLRQGHLILAEQERSNALRDLADTMVEGLDDLRAELSPPELARRRRFGLSEMQESMLQRWGYSAVFGMWRFHMTLTQQLTPAQYHYLQPEADRVFASACAQQRRVDEVCLFVQPGQRQDFTLAARLPIG